MTSIKILTESLLYQDGVDEDVYKDFLGDINQEIDRLTTLINDLLQMTRIENDVGRMQAETASITELTAKAVDLLMPIAAKKNISLSMEGKQVTAECDPLRLRQAINNLIDNAIKYTPEGGKVSVKVAENGGLVTVTVADNGVGMDEVHLGKIFDRFYRVDKARARETGGTGLGLHIVQRIAHLHGGRVEVESKPGEGSTFRFIFPAKHKPEGEI